MISADYVIVGSGLTGGTIARLLADRGADVIILERRRHCGGNVFDERHASGIRMHTYGPHYFRTSSERIWRFVNRFADFYPFSAELMTYVDGNLENWPIQSSYLEAKLGADWAPGFGGVPRNFEEASLAMMPAPVYWKFVRGYTAKQWGVDPITLDAGLAGRFDVRTDGDRRLKQSKFQGLPHGGYARLMSHMIEGIRVLTGFDYLRHRQEVKANRLLIFSGPIDEYFGFRLGRLHYRGQRRTTEYLPQVGSHQPVCQVNYPSEAVPHIRIIEWRHLLPPDEWRDVRGTLITKETPFSPTEPGEFEYPFPDDANAALYEKYRAMADADPTLLICGRLGEYRYYDMDQAIARAMTIADRQILSSA